MPWNPSDQNGQNNDKDPWGRSKKTQGPPDLDALLKQYKTKLITLFGGKESTTGGGIGNQPKEKSKGFFVAFIIGILLIIWGLSGIYIVSPSERAVVLRLGKYVETVGPGPHWIARFIEKAQVVNVQTVMEYSYQSEMLTKDENIISAEITVFYRVLDLENYLFNVVDPIASLEQATASALRQVVGHSTLDDLLTIGKEQVRTDVAKQLQEVLNSYKAGLLITDVNLQSFNPPEAVIPAFDDAIKAQEDEKSYVNQADAYQKKVFADAQGQSARILQEAEAYKQEVVLGAKAEVAGYLALLPEYKKAPNVMRTRLYVATLESVFSKTSKIFLDQKGGSNPLLYLPLDKMSMFNTTTPASSSIEKPLSNNNTTSSNLPNNNISVLGETLNRSSYPAREDR